MHSSQGCSPPPIPATQDICRRNLERNVGPNNVLAILMAADSLGATDMKQQALRLTALHFPHVSRSPELHELPQHLLVEIVTVGGRVHATPCLSWVAEHILLFVDTPSPNPTTPQTLGENLQAHLLSGTPLTGTEV